VTESSVRRLEFEGFKLTELVEVGLDEEEVELEEDEEVETIEVLGEEEDEVTIEEVVEDEDDGGADEVETDDDELLDVVVVVEWDDRLTTAAAAIIITIITTTTTIALLIPRRLTPRSRFKGYSRNPARKTVLISFPPIIAFKHRPSITWACYYHEILRRE